MVKEFSEKSIEFKQPMADDLYSANDPLPASEAHESDSDTVWALWEEVLANSNGDSEADFQSTERAPLMDLPDFSKPSPTKKGV